MNIYRFYSPYNDGFMIYFTFNDEIILVLHRTISGYLMIVIHKYYFRMIVLEICTFFRTKQVTPPSLSVQNGTI